MRRGHSLAALITGVALCTVGPATAETPGARGPDWLVQVDVSQVRPVDPARYRADGRLIYLDRCAGGETVTGASYEDSSANLSTVVTGTVELPAFPFGDATWARIVRDASDIYAPFDVTITEVDPGATPHHEVLLCGTPDLLGLPASYLGASPWLACGVIDKSTSFVFPAVHGDDSRWIAETVAHELGHVFGLEDEYLCEDPMTYLTGCGDKYFQDEDAPCGGTAARTCTCSGDTQNSFAILTEHLGAAEPSPPEVAITEPANEATVGQEFVVRVTISDDNTITWAKLRVDGADVTTLTTPPYVFNAPAGLAGGDHVVEVQAADIVGTIGSDTIHVFVEETCVAPEDCADDESCVDGHCVADDGGCCSASNRSGRSWGWLIWCAIVGFALAVPRSRHSPAARGRFRPR